VRGAQRPLKNANGSVREWVGVHTDIHERNCARACKNMLAVMNEHILTLTDPDEILLRVINLVGEELSLNRCHFIEVDFDRDWATIRQSYLHDAVSTVGSIPGLRSSVRPTSGPRCARAAQLLSAMPP